MLKRIVFALVILVVTPLVAFVLLEGGASLVLLINDAVNVPASPEMAERRHTVYDAELGWANEPSVRIPDLYGPGIGFTTNGQGFRGAEDVTPARPAARRRVVCSGDSFTVGYGVDDASPWCTQLAALGRDVQPVNMGQGGYGVDQAYLWYRRDGTPLEHDLHLFAFILDDFNRARRDRFIGYPKPLLRLRGDSLVVRNYPVPHQERGSRLARYAPVTRSLRAADLLGRVAQRIGRGAEADSAALDSATWIAVERSFDDLAARNRAKQSKLVLVLLPTQWDYSRDWAPHWRRRLDAYARRSGVPFVDLLHELRQLPRDSIGGKFIRRNETQFVGAEGHYTRAGNAWVAARLRAHLEAITPNLFPPTGVARNGASPRTAEPIRSAAEGNR